MSQYDLNTWDILTFKKKAFCVCYLRPVPKNSCLLVQEAQRCVPRHFRSADGRTALTNQHRLFSNSNVIGYKSNLNPKLRLTL